MVERSVCVCALETLVTPIKGMFRVWRGLLLLLAFGWLVPSHGWTAEVPEEFTRQVWRVQDGLPEDTAQSLAQDGQGFLWVGTTGGVARFDGSNFTVFDSSSSPRLPVNSIFCLLAARDGSLWMGSEGGGLLQLKDGAVMRYNAASGLGDTFVRALIEDESGRVWVGTDDGLYRLASDSRRLERMDGTPTVPTVAVHALAEDRAHRIWVGGSRLLVFPAGAGQTKPEEYTLPGKDSQNRVKSILPAADGTVWVGTVGGLERLSGHTFARVPAVAGTVRTLKQTSDGTIWIGTIGHGLWREAEGRLRRVDAAALLPSKSILSVLEDQAHQIWIGTQGGLVRLNETPVHVVRLPQSADPDFETVSRDRDGSVFEVASRVFRIQGKEGLTVSPEQFPSLGSPTVRNLFRASDGALWIGTDGEGAYKVLGRKVEHFRAPRDLPNNFIRAFMEARHGDIWIATDEGLAHLVQGRVQQYDMRNGLDYFSTRSLLESRDGGVWIGTDQGLSQWRDGHFVHDAATAALQGEKVWSLAQDHTGTLWVGTRDHGLFRVKGSRIVQLTRAQGLPSDGIYSITEAAGRLWFSTPNTLFSAPLDELDQVDGRPDQVLHARVYPLPFSANDAQFYGGRQPSACVDKQGRIWFPSSRGAISIAPDEQDPQSPVPVQVLIRNVLVDGESLKPGKESIALRAGSREVAFEYAPLLLSSQSNVRFRYKLDGLDTSWVYAGPARTASYTNLPAGHYRFMLQALDGGQVTAEADLPVEKQPFLWQTKWFAAVVVLVLGGAAAGLYRLRIRRIQDRFQAVLAERGRLAREMHDTVIQGCTSISALLEAIASRRKAAPGREAELLDHARVQMRATIEEARQAVWNLRHRDEPEQGLAAILESLAANIQLEFGIAVNCRWRGESISLAAPIAHEVLMTVREALCNAAVHGRPTHVEIATTAQLTQVQVCVSDDGVGFVPHEDTFHYGVTGMRERAARLGGNLEVRSTPGRGTVVELRLQRAMLSQKVEGE